MFRPLLYETKVLGLHDVLAPINSHVASYPENPDRQFGPWGLSFASDRWDLRRALVLEMRAKEPVSDLHARQVVYVDLQTLQPLYMATYDTKEEFTNIGMYAGVRDRADGRRREPPREHVADRRPRSHRPQRRRRPET